MRQDVLIFNRSALLTICLACVLVFIAAKIYLLWTDGSWELPQPPKHAPPSASARLAPPPSPRLAAADVVIGKNLFDPERGATPAKEAEATNRALQRIKGLILIGTLILGDSSYAIVQDGGAVPTGRPPQGQSNQTLRMKTGDNFEGFRLSEIRDRNVVFANGISRVELALDYFRKVEPSAPVVASAVRPQGATSASPGASSGALPHRVVPQLPRRANLPPPPAQ